MKITLDLARLVEDGRLTADEAERLKAMAAPATISLALNILIGFGVVAVAAGFVGLVPSMETALGAGVAVAALGLFVIFSRNDEWSVFGSICLVCGALAAAGAGLALAEGHRAAFVAVAFAFAATAYFAKSGLMAALTVLALSGALGARSGYWHATYAVGLSDPTLTIVVFTALGLAAYVLSGRLGAADSRLAIMAARASVLLVNLGFWIGSLWGDRLAAFTGGGRAAPVLVPRLVFVVGWAIAIVAAAVWAARANRPWLVNVAAVFGAIHFYTQWFERLGPTPGSVMVAGLVTLAIALALYRFNRQPTAPHPPSTV